MRNENRGILSPREFLFTNISANELSSNSFHRIHPYVSRSREENFEIFSRRTMRTMNVGFTVIPYKNSLPLTFPSFLYLIFPYISFHSNSSRLFPMIYLGKCNFPSSKVKVSFPKTCVISDIIISRVDVFIRNFSFLHIQCDKNKNTE